MSDNGMLAFQLDDLRAKFAEGSIERLEGIHNSVISSWIKNLGKTVKEKLNNIANSIDESNFKKENIKVVEVDEVQNLTLGSLLTKCSLSLNEAPTERSEGEIVTYIKKKLKNGGEYTFIWIAFDRHRNKPIDFENECIRNISLLNITDTEVCRRKSAKEINGHITNSSKD